MSKKPMIPVSEAKVEELQEVLRTAVKGVAQEPEVFINLYNSGFMNKSNDEVKETAEQIVATYKNLREQNNEIIFLSEAEVALDEVRAALEPWYIASSLKRVVSDLVEDNTLGAEDTIAFGTNKDIGYVLKAEQKRDEHGQVIVEVERVGREKLFNRFDHVTPLFESGIVQQYREEDEVILFPVNEVLSIDDSFAVSIRELL